MFGIFWDIFETYLELGLFQSYFPTLMCLPYKLYIGYNPRFKPAGLSATSLANPAECSKYKDPIYKANDVNLKTNLPWRVWKSELIVP